MSPTRQLPPSSSHPSTYLRFLRVRHRVSPQVDQVSTSPALLSFMAQSGRESGFDYFHHNPRWQLAREARDSPSPDYTNHTTPSYHTKTAKYLSNQVLTGLPRLYLLYIHNNHCPCRCLLLQSQALRLLIHYIYFFSLPLQTTIPALTWDPELFQGGGAEA